MGRGSIETGSVIQVKNISTETIPAWGIARVTVLNSTTPLMQPVMSVDKPDGSDSLYVVIVGTKLVANAVGVAVRLLDATTVLVDETTTVAPPDEVGPVTGMWMAGKTGAGLIVMSGVGKSGTRSVIGKAGGSGPPTIRFTIQSTAFTVGLGALGCDHVIVRVNHVSCSGSGVAVGDEADVYDPEYCHFNLPIELLIGLSGTATRMKTENYQVGLDYVLDCLAPLRAASCMWMIDTLCCSEEEIISA